MRIITSQCDRCGSIVAGNVLERYHRVKCPGYDCEAVHRFTDFDDEEQTFLREDD